MGIYRKEILMRSSGKGTYEITGEVAEGVRESGLAEGLASVFVRHTSCSLANCSLAGRGRSVGAAPAATRVGQAQATVRVPRLTMLPPTWPPPSGGQVRRFHTHLVKDPFREYGATEDCSERGGEGGVRMEKGM